nr:hypothetical protein [Gemmatimonadota bacterium]NIR78174.1 hypothetical protein [Gemmatimonadota bacterium]NIT86744.1 hypothetical protein [Gemmatimonadota bacterium]NIU30605.1 hypothetical protein [Gemmatimonadota bacterium]NIU35420.1 hypothetical protein [Gemmatimonadota bacterium]
MISAASGGGCWTWKRTISLLLLIVFIPQATGCFRQHQQNVSPDEFAEGDFSDPDEDRIVGATLTDGEELAFEIWPPARVERDSLLGRVESGLQFSAPISEVERLWVQTSEFQPGRTLLALVGVGAGVFVAVLGLVAATKESCPFIYSWDGSRWVFDAEPYGGATSKGLERADFTELEHLVAVDGEYRLMVTNEVNETQHTNLFELWAVRHEPGTRVVADEFGGLYTVRDPLPLSSAVDASGKDLLPWLQATDRRIWEHEPVRTAAGDLRQEITLTFPKPEGATEARLIANVATGAWGSHMIREFYEMRGTGLDAFHEEIDASAEAREALFR